MITKDMPGDELIGSNSPGKINQAKDQAKICPQYRKCDMNGCFKSFAFPNLCRITKELDN